MPGATEVSRAWCDLWGTAIGASEIASDWQVKGIPHLHNALALQGSALKQGGDLPVGVIVAIPELAVGAKAPQPGTPVCTHRCAHLWACGMWQHETSGLMLLLPFIYTMRGCRLYCAGAPGLRQENKQRSRSEG